MFPLKSVFKSNPMFLFFMIRVPKIKGLFDCPLASCNRAISYRLIKYYRIRGRYIRLSHSFYLGVQAVFSCTFVRFSALHSRFFSASLVSSPSLRYQITRFKGRTESGSLEGSSQDSQWSTGWGTLPKPETPESAAPGPSLTPFLSSAITAGTPGAGGGREQEGVCAAAGTGVRS